MLEMMAAGFADKFGGGLGASLGKSLGSAIGGETGPMISGATAMAYGNTLDGSGWVVNFGSGSVTATSTAPKSQSIDPTSSTPIGSAFGLGGGAVQAGMGTLPMLLLGLLVVAAIAKRKG